MREGRSMRETRPMSEARSMPTDAVSRVPAALRGEAEEWLWHLAYERRLSSHSVAAYRNDLQKHLLHLTENGIGSWGAVTPELVREDLARLHDAGQAARSRLRARSALRGFYRWMVRQRKLAFDPAAEVEAPRAPRSLPGVLEVEDIARLLAACGGAAPLDIRDRALLETGYGAGLRASELTGLGVEEIDFRERWIRVRGKGSKERMLPVGKPALEALRRYFAAARPRLLGRRADPGVVFLNARGGALTRVGLWKILRRRAAAAGIDPAAVHPHLLRHSFATHLLQGGAPLRVVQELLGHSSVTTTEIYTAVDRGFLRRVHREYHPRG